MSRLLRIADVCAKTSLSKATIYRLEAAGRFVRRVHLTECAVAWPESEVDGWIAGRLADRPEPRAA